VGERLQRRSGRIDDMDNLANLPGPRRTSRGSGPSAPRRSI